MTVLATCGAQCSTCDDYIKAREEGVKGKYLRYSPDEMTTKTSSRDHFLRSNLSGGLIIARSAFASRYPIIISCR